MDAYRMVTRLWDRCGFIHYLSTFSETHISFQCLLDLISEFFYSHCAQPVPFHTVNNAKKARKAY